MPRQPRHRLAPNGTARSRGAQPGSSATCASGKGGRAGAAPAGPGRDSHVWEKPRSPSPGRGERSSAGQAPGTAAPAKPPRQHGRRPRSPGGDFDPVAGRACQHLLPAGCAAAAAVPPPFGAPTAELLLVPAPRGRSVPPAGAPAADTVPRPAMLPETGNKLSQPSSSRCRHHRPAPGAAGAAADSDSPRPPLTPRARRRRRPRCPTARLGSAQPSSSSLPVPRQ